MKHFKFYIYRCSSILVILVPIIVVLIIVVFSDLYLYVLTDISELFVSDFVS